MKKKLLSAVLAVCLMFGSAAALPQGYFGSDSQIAASADTSGYYTYTVLSDGSAKITRCSADGRNKESVTIPADLGGHKVSTLSANGVGIFAGLAGMKNANIKTVTLPNTAKTIESSAFASLPSLSVLNLNEGLTTIASSAFLNATSLKSITLPKSLTSLSSAAFEGCTALSNITVKDGNSTYCSVGGVVYNKKKTQLVLCPAGATSISIPSTVTSIPDKALSYAANLKSVTLPDTLKSIGKQAFFGCTSLSVITIPKNVTSIGEKALGYYKDPDSIDVLKVSGFKIRGYKGSAAETYAKSNGFQFEIIGDNTHTHDYAAPTYTWAADGSSCLAKRVCKTDSSHVQTEYAKITSKVKTAATCTEKGVTLYTATFKNENFKTQTKSIKDIAAKGHKWSEWKTTKEPTATQAGIKERYCTVCKKKETGTIPAGGHTHSFTVVKQVVAPTVTSQGYTLYKCTKCDECEKRNYTEKLSIRVFGETRFDTALKIADQLKKENGGAAFKNIIIASGTDFADALSASYLAKVKNAPILITSKADKIMDQVADYIRRNAASGAKIFIVGGEGAVPKDMVSKLGGFSVKRLAGKNRYLTNIEVLKASGVTDQQILVASGADYADALSASAVGKPILLVAGKKLTAEQAAYLKTLKSTKAAVIGGTGAVKAELQTQLKQYFSTVTRIGGKDRFDTSVKVAQAFFKAPPTMTVAYGLNYPDGLCGGTLAMKYGSPLILTVSKNTAAAQGYAQKIKATNTVTFGGKTLITDDALKVILGK